MPRTFVPSCFLRSSSSSASFLRLAASSASSFRDSHFSPSHSIAADTATYSFVCKYFWGFFNNSLMTLIGSSVVDPDPHPDPHPHPHQRKIRIQIRIKVISWIRNRIGIHIDLQMTSQNVWNMILFKHFFKGVSFYLEAVGSASGSASGLKGVRIRIK
jgi:hypothetical protein